MQSIVIVQVELCELCQLAEGLRQLMQVVATQVEVCELCQLAEGLRQLMQFVSIQVELCDTLLVVARHAGPGARVGPIDPAIGAGSYGE